MSLFRSALSFGFFTMISRITGFIRDVLMAVFLGTGILADAFIVAYRLPNMFRSFFAEGAVSVSFVPIFSSTYEEDKHKAENFANQSISFLFYILLIFTLVCQLFMPAIVIMIAPGFLDTADKLALTTELARLAFPILLMVSILSLLAGILNSFDRFAAAAFTPSILNISMILFLLFVSPYAPSPAHALCYGILVAGVIQLLWLYYKVVRTGVHLRLLRPKVVFKSPSPELKNFVKRVIPGLFGSGIYQINILVSTLFVSFLASGSISWLYYATRLFHLPVGTIAVAIGTVLLPTMSRQIKNRDIKGSYASLNKAIEISLLLALPATVGLIVLDTFIVQTLFQHGKFTAEDTSQTAPALTMMALALPALTLIKTFAPTFYARGDTKTPVKIALYSLIINMVFSLILMFPMQHNGIALAGSISSFFSCAVFLYLLRRYRYMNFSRESLIKSFKITLCSLVMGISLYIGNILLVKSLTNLIFLVLLGIAVYFIAILLLRVYAYNELKSILRRR